MKFRRPRSGPVRGVVVVAIALLVTMAVMLHTSVYSGASLKATHTSMRRIESDRATLHRLWKIARSSDTVEAFIAELEKQSPDANGEEESKAIVNKGSIENGSQKKKGAAGSGGSGKGAGKHHLSDVEGKSNSDSAKKEEQTTPAAEVIESTRVIEKKEAASISSPAVPGLIPRLSKELAQQHARNNVIIVTWANLHFAEFVLNWVAHVQQHDITNFLVGAMDQETAELLSSQQVPVFAMYGENATDTGLTKADFIWGSATFHKMGRQKVDLAAAFTSYGLDLCLCDVDTVWINDPTDYFNDYPKADILASSDLIHPTRFPGHPELETWGAAFSAMNIGLLFFRHSDRVAKFCQDWAEMLDADDKLWDQEAFNKLAHLTGLVEDKTEDWLAWAHNKTLSFGVLPVASFASGHTYFVQRLYETQEVKPYVVHTTFQFGGSAGKKHRLREGGLWEDSPEYYTQGRFLDVSVTKPPVPNGFDTWNGTAMALYHRTAMMAQLAEVRDAVAVAVVLNRTIIMPKLYCFCDRYWAPLEDCHLPGSSNFTFPFICPLDHVLQPIRISELEPPNEDDISIDYREYSFLDNPRVPKTLLDERVEVVASPDAASMEQKKGRDGQLKVTVPAGLTDAQIQEMLHFEEDVPLLRVQGSPSTLFSNFVDVNSARKFMHKFRSILDFWCCLDMEGLEGKTVGTDPGFAFAQGFLDSQDDLMASPKQSRPVVTLPEWP